MRIENPSNVVFKIDEKNGVVFKTLGNDFFKNKKYLEAIENYQKAEKFTSDTTLQIALYSNQA